jgi:hypothetical protein
MMPIKITAVANTAGLLLSANLFRNGARVENPLSAPIYVGVSSDPSLGPPSLYVPPANAMGDPGSYVFDGTCLEAWYYKTTGSGDFTVHTW